MDLISNRYGSALFDAAKENGKIEVVLEQLKLIEKILNPNEQIFKILNHPNISTSEKYLIIDEVFHDIFDSSIIALIRLLVEKERIEHIDGIINSYREIYLNYCGMVKATVTSASELNGDQKKKLASKLSRLMHKTVSIEFSQDDSLLAGLLIKIEDKVIDATVKGRLENIKAELLYDAI